MDFKLRFVNIYNDINIDEIDNIILKLKNKNKSQIKTSKYTSEEQLNFVKKIRNLKLDYNILTVEILKRRQLREIDEFTCDDLEFLHENIMTIKRRDIMELVSHIKNNYNLTYEQILEDIEECSENIIYNSLKRYPYDLIIDVANESLFKQYEPSSDEENTIEVDVRRQIDNISREYDLTERETINYLKEFLKDLRNNSIDIHNSSEHCLIFYDLTHFSSELLDKAIVNILKNNTSHLNDEDKEILLPIDKEILLPINSQQNTNEIDIYSPQHIEDTIKNIQNNRKIYRNFSGEGERGRVSLFTQKTTKETNGYRVKCYLEHIFYHSIKNKKIETINFLLENNLVNVNMTSLEGETPLNWAYNNWVYNKCDEDLRILNTLIKNGADINTLQEGEKVLLLEKTFEDWHYDIVNEIVKVTNYKEIVKKLSIDEKEELFYCSCRDNITELALHLAKQKDISCNLQNEEGESLLHLACKNNNEELTQILIDKGVDTDCQNKDGNTPFHYACMQNNFKIIEILIGVEANPYIQNNLRKDATDLAENQEIRNIIRCSCPISRNRALEESENIFQEPAKKSPELESTNLVVDLSTNTAQKTGPNHSKPRLWKKYSLNKSIQEYKQITS